MQSAKNAFACVRTNFTSGIDIEMFDTTCSPLQPVKILMIKLMMTYCDAIFFLLKRQRRESVTQIGTHRYYLILV